MNVLSIDFDIIMAPDINLYNNMVGTSPNGERTIDKRIAEYPMLSGCRADLNHFQKIVNYLMKIIKDIDVENIRVSLTHEDIKNVLDDMENVHIYNIDHHHDLGYMQPSDQDKKNECQDCSCANWGEFFFDKNIIKYFTWINNVNSSIDNKWEKDARVTIKPLAEFNLETLPKIDKLFICLSPEWVPSTYHPLFYLILDLINEEKECHLELH